MPKTIDNDYLGIDFTFGYFTAVETLAGEIRNLLADAEATKSYFLAETMGRTAGWLAYGAAIAGEASLVISVEDILGDFRKDEEVDRPGDGRDEHATRHGRATRSSGTSSRPCAPASGRARSSASSCSPRASPSTCRRNTSTASRATSTGTSPSRRSTWAHMFAKLVAEEYKRQTGQTRKVTGLQLGYEARCALPHAFDVMLGSQLGVGAYRALVEEGLNGVMVSVSGQLDLHYVPFEKLVDPETLVTVVRYIEPESDFHRLARFLETEADG